MIFYSRRSSAPATVSPSAVATGQVDLDALRALLDGRWAAVRDRARDLAADPLFRPVFDLPREEYREHVAAQVRALAAT